MGDYFIGITDKGKRRDKNEDTFIAREFCRKEFVVACVIDGVGGYKGGEVAAAIARSVILRDLHYFQAGKDIIAALKNTITVASKKILEEKKSGRGNEQMACVVTCAIADIRNNKLYFAHVGDTRLYLLRDKSLVKLSRDHSVVGFLEESGRLSEEDAMSHPRRNEITRALGFQESIADTPDFIETGESPFLPGDTMLVCSDGLSDMLSSTTITSLLLKKTSLAERAAELVAAANEAGGNDNITAVLVQNNKQPMARVALKPAVTKGMDSKDKSTVLNGNTTHNKTLPATHKPLIVTLIILLAASLMYILMLKINEDKQLKAAIPKAVMLPHVDTNASRLVQSINGVDKSLTLSQPNALITLPAPVLINKDSFVINGKGTTITGTQALAGPALIVGNGVKQLVLDSIVFKDLAVAIAVQKNNVVFKNVRFINCRVPVAYQILLPDTSISGRLKDSLFIPVTTSKKR